MFRHADLATSHDDAVSDAIGRISAWKHAVHWYAGASATGEKYGRHPHKRVPGHREVIESHLFPTEPPDDFNRRPPHQAEDECNR
jgi:hypothetical protein